MRLLLIAAATLGLAACQIVYKLPTRQGNVIENKQLDQVKPGMTRDQVSYLMGTPVASTTFNPDRWDYVSYYRSPRGEVSERVVTMYFKGDTLARIEGQTDDEAAKSGESPDVEAVLKGDKKSVTKVEGREANDRSAAGASKQDTGRVAPP